MDDDRARSRGPRLGDQVAMACHVNPDADALGSMLGLAAYLRARGTRHDVLVPERAARAAAVGGAASRRPTGSWRRPSSPMTPEVMVTCDCASFDRLGPLGRGGIQRRRAHLDRSPSVERRARHDPVHRSRRVINVRDGLPADRRDGRPDAGRDRRVPVRRARHRHGTLPVRGHHPGHAAHRRRAPGAPVRSFQVGAGAVRGQRGRVPALSAIALRGSAYVPEADLIWTYLTQADLSEAGAWSGRDRRSDRPDPHVARGGRRGGAQAAAGRSIQGQRPFARVARPRRRSPPPSAAADTGSRPATRRGTVRRERSRGWSPRCGEPVAP